MKIPEDKKLDVIMAQIQERYDASHKMRDRSMQFVLWILGFGLGMGWLLISETTLSRSQQVAISVFLVLLSVITLWFVRAIHCGFEKNHQIIIRLEKILRLYEQNAYGTTEPVLPSQYSNTKKKWTGHFETLYAIMVVVFLTLLVLTWINPCKDIPGDLSTNVDPNKTEMIVYD